VTVRQLQQVLLTDMERALVTQRYIDEDLWTVLSVNPRHVGPKVRAVSNPTGHEHFWLARLFMEVS
jgi:hypothetical protein